MTSAGHGQLQRVCPYSVVSAPALVPKGLGEGVHQLWGHLGSSQTAGHQDTLGSSLDWPGGPGCGTQTAWLREPNLDGWCLGELVDSQRGLPRGGGTAAAFEVR